MELFTAFAIYFLIWWLTLFVVLPHGSRSQAEAGKITPGTDPGAPVSARILRKLVINSLVAGLIFLVYWIASTYFGFGLDSLPNLVPGR